MTKHRRIQFSGPMVRALLSGKKTQTRRIIKHPSYSGSCPYGAPGDRLWVTEDFALKDFKVVYMADKDLRSSNWRRARYMPRKFSRITLEITEVRSERLQDISEADCVAEGVIPMLESGTNKFFYQYLWGLIHGWKSWDKNPDVWVISFKVAS